MLPGLAFLILASGMATDPAASGAIPAAASATETTAVPYVIQKRVEEAHVVFTVRGTHRKAAPELTANDVAVIEDEQSPAPLTSFYKQGTLPLRLAVVLDMSGSMQGVFAQERQAAAAWLDRIAETENVEVSIASFATEDRALPGDAHEVMSVLQPPRSDGQTALFDSMYETMWRLNAAEEGARAQKAIVVFSDGEDNWSRHGLDDVIAAAQQSETTIFAITVHSRRVEIAGDEVLRTMAEATGGQAFVLGRYEQVGKALTAIGDALPAQFVVGFRPRNITYGFHTVKVVLRDHALKVKAHSGYYVDVP